MNQIATPSRQGRGPGLYDEQLQRKRQEKELQERRTLPSERPALFSRERS